MLIPLGFLAAAGSGVASDYELISTTIIGTAVASFDFTSIPQTYKHLQIRYSAKSSSTPRDLAFRFNDITTSTYARHNLGATASSLFSQNSTTQAQILMIDMMAATTVANSFGAGIIDVLDYTNTSKNKTVKALYGVVDTNRQAVYLTSGLSVNTPAITKITIFTNAVADIATGSRFSLYGIKG
jgi:hypothetical protein